MKIIIGKVFYVKAGDMGTKPIVGIKPVGHESKRSQYFYCSDGIGEGCPDTWRYVCDQHFPKKQLVAFSYHGDASSRKNDVKGLIWQTERVNPDAIDEYKAGLPAAMFRLAG